MNQPKPLDWYTRAEQSYLACRSWCKEGFEHGFIGKGIFQSAADRGQVKDFFRNWLDCSAFLLLDQVHGKNVLDLRVESNLREFIELNERGKPYPADFQSDAVILNQDVCQGKRIGVGVLTADCVPLIVRRGSSFALIHAGWRGLARGVIAETLAVLKGGKTLAKRDLEVLIGPCAGDDLYEVGAEVVDELGTKAVYREVEGKKVLLSLTGTAKKCIQLAAQAEVAIWSADICTIADERFCSYRRERKLAGRNIAFFVL